MITFKKATLIDIPLIRSLANDSFNPTYQDILSPQQRAWMFDWMYSIESLNNQFKQGQVFFISYYEGIPCGYISIEKQGDHLFHFQKIYVLPHYQKKGVGKSLIQQGIKYIKSLNALPCFIELNVNRQNKAVAFYKHLGFNQATQGDFEIGNGYFMNDYIMQMELK